MKYIVYKEQDSLSMEGGTERDDVASFVKERDAILFRDIKNAQLVNINSSYGYYQKPE